MTLEPRLPMVEISRAPGYVDQYTIHDRCTMTVAVLFLFCTLTHEEYMFLHLHKTDVVKRYYGMYCIRTEKGYIDAFGEFVHEQFVNNTKIIRMTPDEMKRKGILTRIESIEYTGSSELKPIWRDDCYNQPKTSAKGIDEFTTKQMIDGKNRRIVPEKNDTTSSTEENVYEYRSGKLIPGTIDVNARFTPTGKDATINMDEYVYKINKRRIYNLPGKFVLKSEFKKEKEAAEKAGLFVTLPGK